MGQSGRDECNVGHDGSIHHEPTLVNVYVPNLFYWGLKLIVDIQNLGIDNVATRHDDNFKVYDFFYNKKMLQDTFQRHVLESGHQCKMLHSLWSK